MANIGLVGLIIVLVSLAIIYGCFCLSAFIGRKFENTASGVFIGGLVGFGVLIVIQIIMAIIWSGLVAASYSGY